MKKRMIVYVGACSLFFCALGCARSTEVPQLGLSDAPSSTLAESSSARDAQTREKWTKIVEDYFNNLKTLEADFVQKNPDGTVFKGRFYLARPGRMRLDYRFPSNLLLLADGEKFIYYDRQDKESDTFGFDATPASIILKNNISLRKEVIIEKMTLRRNGLIIKLVKENDPDEGAITLIFSRKPFTLLQWKVLDPQGDETEVILSIHKTGGVLSPELFKRPTD